MVRDVAPVLLIRADANSTIGTGHVMRCLALAEAWLERGGRVVFVSEPLPAVISRRIELIGAAVVPTSGIELLLQAHAPRAVVVDGYHLGADVQSALAATGAQVLVIDDDGTTATRAAHFVVNQHASATRDLYTNLDAKLLLGPDYTLLRRAFWTAAPVQEPPAHARRLLVSFGGADPMNLTPRVIDAVAPLAGFEALVLGGTANARAAELRAPSDAIASIQVVPHIDDIATQMRRTDLAIVAAGGTCWELAACGVPLIAVAVAKNQLAVTASIERLRLGITMPHAEFTIEAVRATIMSIANDPGRRGDMARRGRAAVDGCGALRVVDALLATTR